MPDDCDPLAVHDVRPEDRETHRLLAEILERLPHDTDRQRRVELLTLIAQVVGSESFDIAELYRWIAAAGVAGAPLRNALGDVSTRSLGKTFARWASVGPFVVRAGNGHNGGLWRVVGSDFEIAKSLVPERAKIGKW